MATTLLFVVKRNVFPDEAWHAIRDGLFEPTVSYSGDAWARDVLDPWTAANLATVAALRTVGQPDMATSHPITLTRGRCTR